MRAFVAKVALLMALSGATGYVYAHSQEVHPHAGLPTAVRAQLEAVTAHVRDCPACRQFQEAMAAIGGKVRTAGEWEPAPRHDIRGRALDRWSAERESGAAERRPWLHGFAATLRSPDRRLPGASHPRIRVTAMQGASLAAVVLIAALVLVRWEQARRSGVPGPTIAEVGPPVPPAPPYHGPANLLPGSSGTPTIKGPGHIHRSQPPRAPGSPDLMAFGPGQPQFLVRPGSKAPSKDGRTAHPGTEPAPSARPLTDQQYLDGRDPGLLAKWSAVGWRDCRCLSVWQGCSAAAG